MQLLDIWWGFSKEHGWVILDRSIAPNRPGVLEDLLFFKCSDGTLFSEARNRWDEPFYIYAPRYIELFNNDSAGKASTELKELQAKEAELHDKILSLYDNYRKLDPQYREQIKNQLKTIIEEYRFNDAKQFYTKHCDVIEESEYMKLLNKSAILQQQQLIISQAQEQFMELAKKYNVDIDIVVDKSGPTLLAKILTKLEEKKHLDKSEIDWLEHNKIDELLAKYLYSLNLKFGHSTDDAIWNLSRASKFFRRAGLPEKAIKITDNFTDRIITNKDTLILNPSASGAVYTSRGGAFRDMHNFGKAKECAREAIRVSPSSFYPYSLLGGISYDEGMPADAERYFRRAVELGAKQDDQDREIRGVLKDDATDIKIRKTIIDYLLKKDPKKYDWVKQFQLQ